RARRFRPRRRGGHRGSRPLGIADRTRRASPARAAARNLGRHGPGARPSRRAGHAPRGAALRSRGALVPQKVLIVEDEASASRLVASICAEVGLAVLETRSGTEAKAMLER